MPTRAIRRQQDRSPTHRPCHLLSTRPSDADSACWGSEQLPTAPTQAHNGDGALAREELDRATATDDGASLTGGKSRMESVSDWPVEGFLVWESEDALNRFAEVLRPIRQEVGIAVPPEMHQSHAFVTA
jgi:hypothetical protein